MGRFQQLIHKGLWAIRFRVRFLTKNANGVGLVVNSFDKGGLEQVVLNLYHEYKKKGYPVYILCQTRNVGNLAVKLLDLRDIFIFDGQEALFIEFCWKKNIRILHYHYNTFMLMGMRKMGFKVLYTMHNVYTWMSLSEIKAYSYKLTAAHHIVPVSFFVQDYYLRRTIAPQHNIHVIENGIDFADLSRQTQNFPFSREKLKLSNDDITIALIASFHHVKHQIGMIGVMERLVSTFPNVKLLLVGNVGDKNYWEKFQDELEKSSAKENILLISYFDHSYMGQFLRDSVDIFTLPTLQEGCSNAVLEAYYCGKPMVLTRVGNAQEMSSRSSACIVTKPAYSDAVQLTQEDILQISYQKNNSNTLELVSAFTQIIENLDMYSLNAFKAAENYEDLNASTMADKYIALFGV